MIEYEKHLVKKGYKKYNQKIAKETFAYWKSYKGKYQIGVRFYDFSKYKDINLPDYQISFVCMLLDRDGSLDLTSSSDGVSIQEFEKTSEMFFNTFKIK